MKKIWSSRKLLIYVTLYLGFSKLLMAWINNDENDPGYQIYNEDEILSLIIEESPEDNSNKEQDFDLVPSQADVLKH